MLLGDDDDDDDDIGSFNTHDDEGNARTSTKRLGFTSKITVPAWPYASHFVGKFSLTSHLTTTMRNFMHISSATNFSFSFSF